MRVAPIATKPVCAQVQPVPVVEPVTKENRIGSGTMTVALAATDGPLLVTVRFQPEVLVPPVNVPKLVPVMARSALAMMAPGSATVLLPAIGSVVPEDTTNDALADGDTALVAMATGSTSVTVPRGKMPEVHDTVPVPLQVQPATGAPV